MCELQHDYAFGRVIIPPDASHRSASQVGEDVLSNEYCIQLVLNFNCRRL